MATNTDIDFPPLPSQAPPQIPQQTLEQKVKSKYYYLVYQLVTLQTTSLLLFESNSYYQNSLIPYLPQLLTPQRTEGISIFRRAFLSTSPVLKQKNRADNRNQHFGSALLWALDHAETCVCDVGQGAELRLMQSFSAIFHLVTRFCNQEWGLANGLDHEDHTFDTSSVQTPSKHDPVYSPQIVRNPETIKKQRIERVQDQVKENVREELPNSYSALFPRNSHYIRRNGKQVMPFACIQHARDRCLVPFKLVFAEQNSYNEETPELRNILLGITYPDKTIFEFIPVRNARFLYKKTSRHLAADDKACAEKRAIERIEMDRAVYEAVIGLSKQTYLANRPDSAPDFLTGIARRISGKRIQLSIPVLPSCYVRVMDGQMFAECLVQKAFEMCEHDLSGYALLKVELLERAEDVRIVISLIGMLVERNLLNYGDAIFDLLDLRTAVGKEARRLE